MVKPYIGCFHDEVFKGITLVLSLSLSLLDNAYVIIVSLQYP
jgi:hypothetical protein